MKWTSKILHLIEHWLNVSNLDFKSEMAAEFEYELKKIGYIPTLPNSIYRGIKIPKEYAYCFWNSGTLQQPRLTSWSTDFNVAKEFASETPITLNPISSDWGQSLITSNYTINYSNVILNLQDICKDEQFKFLYHDFGVDQFPNIEYYIFSENNKEKEIICKSPSILSKQVEVLGYNPGVNYPAPYTSDIKWINKNQFGEYSPYYNWKWNGKLF